MPREPYPDRPDLTEPEIMRPTLPGYEAKPRRTRKLGYRKTLAQIIEEDRRFRRALEERRAEEDGVGEHE